MENIHLPEGKKIYFASDFHLGVPSHSISAQREQKIVRWLNQIQPDVHQLFLVGDVFDFWFEYKKVVPKGYIRLLGKLAELVDAGVQIHLFKGNHDMWQRNYFQTELGAKLHSNQYEFNCGNKAFYIHHGDGLGPGDSFYKFIKKIFRNPFFQRCFQAIHPDLGIGIADFFSGRSRVKNARQQVPFEPEKEWLLSFVKEEENIKHRDFFIFGHRHYLFSTPIKTLCILI